MTDHNHIDTLKEAADPQRVAVALGLHGRGSRFFCPLCQPQGGKSPDLSVRDKGFRCHKCGEKGDVLKLIMVALDMDFPSAVAWLEKETGITSPRRRNNGTGKDKGRGLIVEPGASCEAVRPDPIKTTGPAADPAIYEAFLSSCRPVEGRPLEWLTKDKGIAPDVVVALGLRFCGKEYRDIMDALKVRFGEGALKVAGLLKKAKTTPGLVPSFWYYYANKTGFLVIPYMKDGLPVYLKVRPPMGKEEAERRELVRFLNTAAGVPCLYNADILSNKLEKVLICEGESDTWTALSYGFAAVGSPGASGFKSSWVESFRGIEDGDGRSRVYLVLDADKAGGEGSLVIADLFLKAGLPVPLKLILSPGMDLTDYMKDGKT
ncbi:MAG: CHC2 zinc finger domain-containing protein [Candidatus Omnitrophota bacterium]|nr:CHC2 zinc finger domain-containing protein [Candidatus Omnitrophota bacterium]